MRFRDTRAALPLQIQIQIQQNVIAEKCQQYIEQNTI